jgi:hypothetical protein
MMLRISAWHGEHNAPAFSRKSHLPRQTMTTRHQVRSCQLVSWTALLGGS